MRVLAGNLICKLKENKAELVLDENIIKTIGENCGKTAFVTGTNGTTTTTNILNHILEHDNSVISNVSESNMDKSEHKTVVYDGCAKYDWGIFKVDMAAMPLVSKLINPDYIIVTNFFRSQLDKYGAEEYTINSVHESIKPETTLILNGDDPSTLYFDDLNNEKIYYSKNHSDFSQRNTHVEDLIFCPKCGARLEYEYINYGNIGKYHCPNCGVKNPISDYTVTDVGINEEGKFEFEVNKKGQIVLNLLGSYNLYNTIAAISIARKEDIDCETIKNQIEGIESEKGRMEEFEINGNKVVLSISKNPVSLTEVLKAATLDPSEKSLMIILNDSEIDGEDISWIWDADFSDILKTGNIDNFYCGGSRAEDMAIRLKYEDFDLDKIKLCPSKCSMENSIEDLLNEEGNNSKYIIGTQSAVPQARKILVDKIGDE